MEDYQPLLDAMQAAGFTTRELGIIAETSMGTSLDGITQASEPIDQALALIHFAERYGLVANLRRAVLYTGADRPALQNMLLGKDMPQPTDDQRNTAVNSLDIVRLENRVGRVEDKVDSLFSQVQSLLQRNTAPLNWNIIGWGVMLALIAGATVWAIGVVN